MRTMLRMALVLSHQPWLISTTAESSHHRQHKASFFLLWDRVANLARKQVWKYGNASGQEHSLTEGYGVAINVPAPIKQKEESRGRVTLSIAPTFTTHSAGNSSLTFTPPSWDHKKTKQNYLHSNPCFRLFFHETKLGQT